MKTTIILSCALALAAGVATAGTEANKQEAPAKSAKAVAKPTATQSGKTTVRLQTGSRFPRGVNLSGRITDGPYQLVVISSEAIRRSGYAQLSGVLGSQNARR